MSQPSWRLPLTLRRRKQRETISTSVADRNTSEGGLLSPSLVSADAILCAHLIASTAEETGSR